MSSLKRSRDYTRHARTVFSKYSHMLPSVAITGIIEFRRNVDARYEAASTLQLQPSTVEEDTFPQDLARARASGLKKGLKIIVLDVTSPYIED